MKIAIVSIMKNEAEYILEWIAYHRYVLGVDDFFIADNVSDDGSSELLEALDQAGIINRIHHPRVSRDIGVQKPAYDKIIRDYSKDYDYFLFLDADEFLVNETGQGIKDWLKRAQNNDDFAGVVLNWRIFGSSGRKLPGQGLVVERFSRCSKADEPRNAHIKSLVKCDCIDDMQIHQCSITSGSFYNENLARAVFSSGMLERSSKIVEQPSPFTVDINNQKFYVAHFVVKSYKEHFEKKSRKGSGAGSADREKGVAYFRDHDLNQRASFDLFKHSLTIRTGLAFLVKELAEKTHYYSYIQFALDKSADNFTGWVISDSMADVVLLLRYAGEEKEYQLNVERPDLVRKEMTDVLLSGFKHPIPNDADVDGLTVKVKGTDCYIFSN
jgi:hypothetical protein